MDNLGKIGRSLMDNWGKIRQLINILFCGYRSRNWRSTKNASRNLYSSGHSCIYMTCDIMICKPRKSIQLIQLLKRTHIILLTIVNLCWSTAGFCFVFAGVFRRETIIYERFKVILCVSLICLIKHIKLCLNHQIDSHACSLNNNQRMQYQCKRNGYEQLRNN